MEILANGKLQDDKIEKILTWLQRVYLVLIILNGASLLFQLVDFEQSKLREIDETAIGLAMYWGVYVGLRSRRSWAITLVLITSAFGFFSSFCKIIDPAGDILALIGKVFSCLFLFFFGYQIIFFRKREVRLFFGTKGQVLF